MFYPLACTAVYSFTMFWVLWDILTFYFYQSKTCLHLYNRGSPAGQQEGKDVNIYDVRLKLNWAVDFVSMSVCLIFRETAYDSWTGFIQVTMLSAETHSSFSNALVGHKTNALVLKTDRTMDKKALQVKKIKHVFFNYFFKFWDELSH